MHDLLAAEYFSRYYEGEGGSKSRGNHTRSPRSEFPRPEDRRGLKRIMILTIMWVELIY
jgi:hypothetical protein